jgi:hypothetical protein
MGSLSNQNKHQERHLSMSFPSVLTVFHLIYLLLSVQQIVNLNKLKNWEANIELTVLHV